MNEKREIGYYDLVKISNAGYIPAPILVNARGSEFVQQIPISPQKRGNEFFSNPDGDEKSFFVFQPSEMTTEEKINLCSDPKKLLYIEATDEDDSAEKEADIKISARKIDALSDGYHIIDLGHQGIGGGKIKEVGNILSRFYGDDSEFKVTVINCSDDYKYSDIFVAKYVRSVDSKNGIHTQHRTVIYAADDNIDITEAEAAEGG